MSKSEDLVSARRIFFPSQGLPRREIEVYFWKPTESNPEELNRFQSLVSSTAYRGFK